MSNTYVNNQFKQTKDLFTQATGVNGPITFEQWANQPEDMKAAILFVNFYDQITLAWYKVKGEHTYEEDGVDEAMHICSKLCGLSTKQTTIEKALCGSAITASTFKPAYIFNAMRNAFSSLNYDHKATRSQYQHPEDEITVQGQHFTNSNGDEADIFDTVDGGIDPMVSLEKDNFWAIIDNMDVKTQDAIEKLMKLDEEARTARIAASKAYAAISRASDEEAVKKAQALAVKKSAEASKLEDRRVKFVKSHGTLISMLKDSLGGFATATC